MQYLLLNATPLLLEFGRQRFITTTNFTLGLFGPYRRG